MQRLFSTFADGPPGAGLLMQRVLVGSALVYCVAARPVGMIAAQIIGAVAGLLLIAGLWTPVAGIVVAATELWIAFSMPAHPAVPIALAVLGVTLALIGPGEWSVDARLYGRKHITPPRL